MKLSVGQEKAHRDYYKLTQKQRLLQIYTKTYQHHCHLEVVFHTQRKTYIMLLSLNCIMIYLEFLLKMMSLSSLLARSTPSEV